MKTAAHILVVDDDAAYLSVLQRSIVRMGYEVASATSGEVAMELCRQQAPDLALLDMRMPGMSGLELAARIREMGDVPIIFLSGASDDEMVEQASQMGGLTYLVKPMRENQLGPAIETALERAADIRALQESTAGLSHALSGERAISIAVGILMERDKLGPEGAQEQLRQAARAGRRKLSEVAIDLVQATSLRNAVGGPKRS